MCRRYCAPVKSHHCPSIKYNSMTDQEKIKAMLAVVQSIAEIIRLAKEIPSGHLYARLMNSMDLNQYTSIIECLKRTGLIEEINHMLKWKGPGQWKG